MAMQDYSVKDHPGGAKCIRVTGSGGFQKYFPQSERAAAEALSAKLDKQTKKILEERLRQREPAGKKDSRRSYDTECGVAGVNMSIAPPRSDGGGWKAMLVLQAMNLDQEVVSRSRRVTDKNIDEKFKELLVELKNAKKLKRMPRHWLTRNPPTVKRFNALASQMRRAGHKVDTDFLT